MIVTVFSLIILAGFTTAQEGDDIFEKNRNSSSPVVTPPAPGPGPGGKSKPDPAGDPAFCALMQEKCQACKNGTLMGGTYTGFVTSLACTQESDCSVVVNYIKYANVDLNDIVITCTWPSKNGADQMERAAKMWGGPHGKGKRRRHHKKGKKGPGGPEPEEGPEEGGKSPDEAEDRPMRKGPEPSPKLGKEPGGKSEVASPKPKPGKLGKGLSTPPPTAPPTVKGAATPVAAAGGGNKTAGKSGVTTEDNTIVE